MNISKHISVTAFLAAASLGVSPAAWALGLGDATVESFLNQPLKARIDLITRETDDLASVRASLASADDYELIGATREQMPVPIRFTIEDIDGDAYLQATSSLPIADPVVRLIVEVNWSNGRMLREYTLFLDPAMVPSVAPAPRVPETQPPAPATAAAPAPTPAPEPAVEPEAARIAPATAAPAQVSAGDYGPVRSGETLWAIARDWSAGTGMDINRVMIAIQRENPEAFLNDNINLLKRGAILRMPAMADVDRISRSEAYREVEKQAEAFSGRRARDSAASTETPLISEAAAAPPAPEPEPVEEAPALAEADEALEAVEESVEEVVEDALETAADETAEAMEEAMEEAAEEPTAAAEAEPRDQLELVPPSADSDVDSASGFEESPEAGGAVAAVQDLREDLARTEEELVNQQQQNEYLEERIRELEAQLAETQQGTVEDADMARMEERLRQERQAQAAEGPGSWYGRLSYWLLGLLVLTAAGIGWVLNRRGAAAAAAEEEAISGIKDEAEEVLRVLGDEPATPPPPAAEEKEEEAAEEEEPSRKAFEDTGEDAEVLDEESSDPEIQLDLARAYISMGDREAARVILEEVISNGNEEQQAEATKMMKHL